MKINDFISKSTHTLNCVYEQINKNEYQIVFVVDEQDKVLFAVSDGDIRRYLLSGGDLQDNVLKLNKNSLISSHSINEANILCKQYKLVPVLDDENRIKIIVSKQEILCRDTINTPVVIQAGGLGTRLYPYTKILPKPLIPIGDIPIIEKIINRFVEFGCRNFYIIVNHKKEMIKAYFAEIAKEYKIHFIDESTPLGTGGGLSLAKGIINEPFIFANCDTFLDCDFNDVFQFHKKEKNLITIICSNMKFQIPYGTVKSDQNKKLAAFEEKPTFRFLSNVGVYVVDNSVIDLIPQNTKIHFTTICENLMNDKKVGVYEIREEEWHDMGEIDKLNKMIEG